MIDKKGWFRLRGNWDVFVWIAFIIVSALLFGHSDFLITAQRSYAYLNNDGEAFLSGVITNISDFYTKTWEMAGNYGANYLPSTFIVYAIWNIPYKLILKAPEYWGDWSLIFQIWNRLLSAIVFIISSVVFYKILKDHFGLEEKNKKSVFLVFCGSPIAFFSQFIFNQYDSITVCLMLCGIYFYFKQNRSKKDGYLFVLFFALATTFKYYAILIFLILLVLEEKKVIRLCCLTFLAMLPCLLEVSFYLFTDREVFIASVLEFGALGYSMAGKFDVGFASINVLPLALCLVLACAYKTKTTCRVNVFRWFVFYSSCICACLFGLMTWHPQWLLFAIPFWSMLFLIQEDNRFLLFLDTVFSVVFIAFVSKCFINSVDQNLFRFGLLGDLFRYRIELPIEKTMGNYFPVDGHLLYTVFVAIMIVYCIFGKPKKDNGEKLFYVSDAFFVSGLRARFLVGVLAFMIPACACLPNIWKQDEKLWASYNSETRMLETVYLEDGSYSVVQYVSGTGHQINTVSVTSICATTAHEDLQITLDIIDTQSGDIVGSSSIAGYAIHSNGTSYFPFEACVLDEEHTYAFCFKANQEQAARLQYVVYEPGYVKTEFFARKGAHLDEKIVIGNNECINASLDMDIYGRYH